MPNGMVMKHKAIPITRNQAAAVDMLLAPW